METCCGEIAYPNEWNKCWKEFFFNNRLEFVIGKIQNKELDTLFEKLCSKKDQLFDGAKVPGFYSNVFIFQNYISYRTNSTRLANTFIGAW